MRAAIIGNGEFPRREYPRYLIREAELRICCDAGTGLRGLLGLGLEPDVIVGDMDTASSAVRRRFAAKTVSIEEQDDNDLAKAFAWLRENRSDASEIYIFGACGRSEAHTLGNLAWLMEWEKRYSLSKSGVDVRMVSDYNEAFAISRRTQLHVGAGRKLSIFCADPSVRVKSEGLQWPTADVILDAWWKGSLNRACSDVVTLEPSGKAPLLVILD